MESIEISNEDVWANATEAQLGDMLSLRAEIYGYRRALQDIVFANQGLGHLITSSQRSYGNYTSWNAAQTRAEKFLQANNEHWSGIGAFLAASKLDSKDDEKITCADGSTPNE